MQPGYHLVIRLIIDRKSHKEIESCQAYHQDRTIELMCNTVATERRSCWQHNSVW